MEIVVKMNNTPCLHGNCIKDEQYTVFTWKL